MVHISRNRGKENRPISSAGQHTLTICRCTFESQILRQFRRHTVEKHSQTTTSFRGITSYEQCNCLKSLQVQQYSETIVVEISYASPTLNNSVSSPYYTMKYSKQAPFRQNSALGFIIRAGHNDSST